MTSKKSRFALGVVLMLTLVAAVGVAVHSADEVAKTRVVAYFDNSNGIFTGDNVLILGVPVGKVDKIEPQPDRVKISFWYDAKYRVPAEAKAAILSPSLVTSRAIQLTPVYTDGPLLSDSAVIPQSRTAVPVEYDDFRLQLQRLSESLQPTQPGGVSTLGELVNTTADNLRGQGADIRETVIKLSQVFSALGDHSGDLFGTVKNLSTLVSALQGSTDQMRQLNRNLAEVTGLMANDDNEIGYAVGDFNAAISDVRSFVSDNRESLGTASDRLASITTELNGHVDDIEQALHVLPTTVSNFVNIYHPAQGGATGALALNNFANPISFICGAIQAASRLGAEESAKLCVQYLAPIIKNRQYNFLPLGMNPLVGTQARPNELTYSEDRLRPDYIPSQHGPISTAPPELSSGASTPVPDSTGGPALAAEAQPTNAADGLPGLMIPSGAGS
ncbi:MAG: virulence factor Mce family protein [Mycobacterium sp.]